MTSVENRGEEISVMLASRAMKKRRLTGLFLLLAGLALAAGGLFFPWLRIDCSAHCSYGSWPLIREPATDHLFLVCWPMWLTLLLCVPLAAAQEFRRTWYSTAVPVLLLAGALLVMQAIGLVSNMFTGFSTEHPVLTYTLLPGCAVSLLGTTLVGVGGWLRYHPVRLE